jgi:hypothetical protein
VKGLLIGASRMNEDITGRGTGHFGPAPSPYEEHSNSDWLNQFYGQYTLGKLEIDSEWRRYWRDQEIQNGTAEIQTDVRGSYVAASYRVTKWFQAGSYYSRYSISIPAGTLGPAQDGHTYDTVVTGRFDLNRFTNLKAEGHFMSGVGVPGQYPDGFYSAVNPLGLKPDTNAFVLKAGFNF